MKKLIVFLVVKNTLSILSLIFAITLLFSSCSKDINFPDENKNKYLGPNSTTELSTFLENSTDPAILTLDSATKESLIRYTIFEDGILRGWSHKDNHLKRLDDTNILEVLSAIVKVPVRDIGQKTNKSARGGTHCKNCYWERDSQGCCHTSGDGCYEADTK